MRQPDKGFTLIEIIVVIVVAGILSGITTHIITQPVKSYVDLSRRTTLVDIAEMSLRRILRDIRRALPNSIRITGGGTVLEILHTVDGGRYRAAGSGDVLDFTATTPPDNSFEVIGTLQNFSAIDTANDQLVIYNLGSGISQADAYQNSNNNRASLTAASSASNIVFSSKKFPLSSPQQRFFIVDTPVTFRCDTSAVATKNKQLQRYQGYPILASQPNPPAVSASILANHVSGCVFSYNSGTATRSGLVTLEITLTDEAGESVHLMHQVHVDNIP